MLRAKSRVAAQCISVIDESHAEATLHFEMHAVVEKWIQKEGKSSTNVVSIDTAFIVKKT